VLTRVVNNKIFKQISAWLPVVIWAFLIFHFSSGTVPLASAIHCQDFAVKKTGHILLFGALAVLSYRGLRMNGIDRKKAAVWAVVMAGLYGVSDEYHQMFTSGREPHVRDVFIDLGGASLIILAVYQFIPKLSKKMRAFFEKLDLT
jgi:VanZ family protein